MIEVLTNAKGDFRKQPIGKLAEDGTALDYHSFAIDLDSKNNQEKLVDLVKHGIACNAAYARAMAPYHCAFRTALPTVYIREGVAIKLLEVNTMLRSYGAEILALDGYRPIALQKELWDYFIRKGKQALPQASDEEIVRFAGQYCSDPRKFDPSDFRTWPVHNTGGAIDLTLRWLVDGQELFMGGIFDDADEISWTRYYEDEKYTSESAQEARRNRRLLYHSMRAAGFENYHYEWWHFDLGTQMWAMNQGKNNRAYYGRAELPA